MDALEKMCKIVSQKTKEKMKTEIDYVVEQIANNGMKVISSYTDRLKMLAENPNVNKQNFIAIEDETTFARYNEVNGKKMKWEL